jgi:predicted signal transduction protein with EAL and GGDEF domain
MVGRFGGAEFLLILNRCSPSSALTRAENIRAIVAKRPFQIRSKPLAVTISIGIALSTDFPTQVVEEILVDVDTALYAAKDAGRNCVRLAVPEGARESAGLLGKRLVSPVDGQTLMSQLKLRTSILGTFSAIC